MRNNHPSPSRRPSRIVLYLFALAAGAALATLFGVPPFDSSRAAESSESAAIAADPVALTDAGSLIPTESIAADPVSGASSATAALQIEAQTEAQADAAPEAAAEASELASETITEGVLARGETLAQSMAEQGVGVQIVDQIAKAMIGHYDFRRAQPGHGYRLVQNADGEIESFDYRISPIISYELSRNPDGGYEVARKETDLWPRPAMIAGVVTSSLYGAITDLGGEPQLVSDFTEVFAYDIDFSRMLKPGDEFRILYERLYRTDEDGKEVFVRPGRILAARYAGASGEHTAVYFESSKGRGGYYRPDGTSVQRQFLLAPVRYARISSRYSSARHHPILNITRPHRGIDYAAPLGTPVFAVASGEVIYNGWAGGFGNLVKIRHADGYVSYYGHLSRFTDGLHVGQPVSQKQVIGYVGSTGLSTGPHVCFRIAKDGHYVNPIQLSTPEGPPLSDELKRKFQARRDTILASLDSGTLVAADEAL
jgi:murein DD-endopeptidase MepM/ murein hydrolase activator NlpD